MCSFSVSQSVNQPVRCLLLCLQDGMTPLMHAAYQGRTDVCHLLLQHGADVNCNQHEYGYTALMFAALSGESTSLPPHGTLIPVP